MKKTLQIVLFSVLGIAGSAQHKAAIKQQEGPKSLVKITAEDPVRSKRPSQGAQQQSSNRDIVFHETFENGFAGSTAFGAWTHEHKITGVPSTQGSQWSIGDTNYVNFYGSGVAGADALASSSPESYALWDGAAYAELFPNTLTTNSSYTGYLFAPVLDFTELSTVLVDFETYFRYCCFPDSPVSLDVSTDGGATWTVFNALGDAIEGANIRSANPLNTTIDISCAAAGQSSVSLRFTYNSAEAAGYTHYFWAIDEVVIYGNDNENDLFIKELVNGDILNDWEHRVTPMEQRRSEASGGIVLGVLVGNKGLLEQSDVSVSFTITDPDGGVHPVNPESFHLYSATSDTVCPHVGSTWKFWNSDYYPEIAGTYQISATITGLAENEDAEMDNTITETIVFSGIGEYGHDGDTADDFQWQIGSRFLTGTEGPREPSGFGSHYTFPNDVSFAHGITVRFGSNTESGVEFRAVLIEQATGTSLDNSATVAAGNYETGPYVAEFVNEPLFFPFNGPFPVGGVYPAEPYDIMPFSSGNNYVAAIWRQNSGIGQLSVRAMDHNDVDLSSVIWERGGDQAFHWFHFQEYNYAVRLILTAPYVNHTPISTDEIDAPRASFNIYPNPAVNDARIAFSLTESSFIAYEVRDLQGRLIETDNVGRFAAGDNSFSINVADYAAGNYIVGLVVEGKEIFTQQMAVKK